MAYEENRDTITGRLTKDPIIKDRVTFLNIGKNTKLQSGEYGKSLWIKIVCFKAAKEIADTLRKGDIIRAHGELYCGEDFTKTDGTVVPGGAEFKAFKLESAARRDDHGERAARDAFRADSPGQHDQRERRSAEKQSPKNMPPVDIDDDTSVPF